MVVDAKAVPPVATVYHLNAVPDATKFATVGELQNDCADAVGAAVVFIVIETMVLELSHEFTVCDTK